ncbi:MAG TPA: CAP domain-containing protein, partial [Chloroflexota bacterium]|nr:CAP domain-containing protein [Chloroflexota bacterium]
MRFRNRALLVVAVGILLLGPFVGHAPTPVHAASPADQAVALVNAERARQGLPPLRVAPELAAAAQSYAQLMASRGFFSHDGPDGSTMVSRDQAAGYTNWTLLEENLAAGNATAPEAVAAWLASPEHRANILSPKVDETGVGFAVQPGSPYTYYWVEEFGARTGGSTLSFTIAPSPSASGANWTAPTGHSVSGDWLAWVRAHGDVDTVGL